MILDHIALNIAHSLSRLKLEFLALLTLNMMRMCARRLKTLWPSTRSFLVLIICLCHTCFLSWFDFLLEGPRKPMTTMNMPFQKRIVVFDTTNCEVSPQKKTCLKLSSEG